jgi:hypothetical protein
MANKTKYVVCERTTELRTGGTWDRMNADDLKTAVETALYQRGDFTPDKETAFDTLDAALEYYNTLSVNYRFGRWALRTLDVDEVYIEKVTYDEYWDEWDGNIDIVAYKIADVDWEKAI